jgi:hypothetical protein
LKEYILYGICHIQPIQSLYLIINFYIIIYKEEKKRK